MGIDPRGPRFAALITTVVLAVVLITGSVWLLAAQALVFAAGSVFGLRYSPYGLLYRRLIRPRLGPPGELEPESPPRFAQAVGLVFAIAGVAGYAAGVTWLGRAATAAALAAAFLNGAFGYCLGCEMYLLIRRIWPGRQALAPATADKEA
jgi:membrane protein implicated in regulation of membrane protease activity